MQFLNKRYFSLFFKPNRPSDELINQLNNDYQLPPYGDAHSEVL